jgi:hypothetical protein
MSNAVSTGMRRVEDQGLRHLVVRPDQDHHTVAAVRFRFQVLAGYPGGLQGASGQPVQAAPEFPLVRIASLG